MIDQLLRWVWDSVPTHRQVKIHPKLFWFMESAAFRADRKEQER